MTRTSRSILRAAAMVLVMVLGGMALLAAQAGGPSNSLQAAIHAVRYHVEPARTRVWFETNGSLFYTHYSPDPLTLVIDLPGVDVSAIAERTVVGSQEVDSILATRLEGDNGKTLSRIEIKLSSLVPYQISATEHALSVLFEGAGTVPDETPVAEPMESDPSAAGSPAATSGSEAPDVEQAVEQPVPSTDASPDDISTTPLASQPRIAGPAGRAGDDGGDADPSAPTFSPFKAARAASFIDRISHAVTDDLLTVTVGADGWLNYTSFRLDEPERLVFDFTGVINRVPRQRLAIEALGIHRVRVAQFQSTSPRITRVVFDMERQIGHRVIEQGSELKIFFSPSEERLAGLAAESEGAAPDMAGQLASFGSDTSGAVNGYEAPQAAVSEPSEGTLPVAYMEPVAFTPQNAPPSAMPPQGEPSPELPSPPQEEAMPTPPASETLEGRTIGGEQKEYTGELISLDFKDGDIQDIFRLFADISGLNIVVQPGVSGRVTLVLTEVPWDQALELILKSHRLGYVVEGNVIRIAPLADLAAEEAERRRLAEEQALAGELSTMIRELSYAKANDIQSLIQRNLSARGDIVIDGRTNTLIITDLPDRLDTIDSLIDTLDAPIPGVEIGARVVVTTRNYSRNLGIQWGFTSHQDALFGNSTELTFPNSVLVDGQPIGSGVNEEFRTDTQNAGVQPPLVGADDAQRGYAVNLPVPGEPTGAIGVSLGSITGAFNIDVALSAAERRGQVRIISAPKIITQNNKAAEIKQGLTFPVQVVANNTVTVTFKDAVLELEVTPQITSADTIILDIELNNDTADFGRSVNGIPSIITQSATTQVLVADGSTTVIGGVFVNTESKNQEFVPLLHKIPLLGNLFKNSQVSTDNQELLIFLTPRIRKGEV